MNINNGFAIIQTDPVKGALFVDGVSMIGPRALIDSTRGLDAGIETFAREASSPIIEIFMPGMLAVGVGRLLGQRFIDKDVKVDASLSIESDTVHALSQAWKSAHRGKRSFDRESVQKYVQNILDDTKGIVGTNSVKFPKSLNGEKKSISARIAALIMDKKLSEKEIKEKLAKIKSDAVKLHGASENLKVGSSIETTMDRLVDNLYDMGKKVFKEVGTDPKKLDAAINKITKTSGIKSLITLGLISSIGFSQQFINRYITKKRTGKDAFVGLPEELRDKHSQEKPDKESKFKLNLAKAASVASIFGISAASVTGSLNPKKIFKDLTSKNIVKKLEFNSKWVNLNQLRAIYAIMIAGRILASSDKNELRETDTRDIPGFLNWLVLGSFVSKIVGSRMSKKDNISDLINYSAAKPVKDSGFVAKFKHLIKNQNLVTHAEIDAREFKGLSKIEAKAKKALLKKQLNIAIGSGILYSTVALGIFVPWLNKKITNKLTADKKAPNNSNLPKYPLQRPIVLNTNASMFFRTGTVESDRKILADFMNN